MGFKLTKATLKKLPKIGATEIVKAEEKVAHVKFFGGGRWTWYAVEFDGADQFFGYVVSGLGEDCDEWGYFSLSELQAVRVPIVVNGEQRGSIGLEVDKFWRAGVIPELQAEDPKGPKGGEKIEARSVTETVGGVTRVVGGFGSVGDGLSESERANKAAAKAATEEKEFARKLKAGMAKEEKAAKGTHAPLTDQTAELMAMIQGADGATPKGVKVEIAAPFKVGDRVTMGADLSLLGFVTHVDGPTVSVDWGAAGHGRPRRESAGNLRIAKASDIVSGHVAKSTEAHNAQAAAAGPKPKARRMKITDVAPEAPEVAKARAAFEAEKATPPKAEPKAPEHFAFDAAELRAVALAFQGTKEAPEPMTLRFKAQVDMSGRRIGSLVAETLGADGDELRVTISALVPSALAFVVEASTLAEKLKPMGAAFVTLRPIFGGPGRLDAVAIEEKGKAHAEIKVTDAPEPMRWPVDGAPRAIELRAVEVPLSHVAQAVGVNGERARMARIHVSHNADGWALTATDGSRIHQGTISAVMSGAAGNEPTTEGTLPGDLVTAWLELVQAFAVDPAVPCVVNWHAGNACTLQVIAGALRFELLSGFTGHSFPDFKPTIPSADAMAWIQVSGLELERVAEKIEGAWKVASAMERKAAALRVKSLPKGATAAQKDDVRARITSVAMALIVSDSKLSVSTATPTDTDGNGSRYVEAPEFAAWPISSVASDRGVVRSARVAVDAAFMGEALAHVLSNGDSALIGFVIGKDMSPIVVKLPSTNVSALIMPIASASNARCIMADGQGAPKAAAKPTAKRKPKATKTSKAGG